MATAEKWCKMLDGEVVVVLAEKVKSVLLTADHGRFDRRRHINPGYKYQTKQRI